MARLQAESPCRNESLHNAQRFSWLPNILKQVN